MKALTPCLDLDDEQSAIAAFLQLKWAPIAKLDQLLSCIRATALATARTWTDKSIVGDHACKLLNARKTILKDQGLSALAAGCFDATAHYLDGWMGGAILLEKVGRELQRPWDYSREMNALTASLLDDFPALAKVVPLGFDKMATAYLAGAAFDYDSSEDEGLFDGTKIEGTLSGDFVQRTGLPTVVYLNVEKGYSNADSLVGAVFAHFLLCQAYLNSLEVCKAINALVPTVDGPLMFELKLDTEYGLLRALTETIEPPPGEHAYRQYLADLAEYRSLTQEQRAIRDAITDAEMDALIDEVKETTGSNPKEQILKEKLLRYLG